MCNMHHYLERFKILHENTYEEKYIDIVDSSDFFLSELEEMERCIYRAETANAGMRLQWLWHHLLVLPLGKFWLTGRISKMQFATRICYHYPMLILHIAGLRIYNGEIIFVKCWIKVRRKRTMKPTIQWRDAFDCLLERDNNHFTCFFRQHQTCYLQPDIRSPNTVSSVTCSRGKVKFSSSLSGSSTNSGKMFSSILHWIQIKH